MYIGFENDEIKYVGRHKPQKEKDNNEIICEADTVTPGFIDSHSHIGMARSGEPSEEEEANEHMKNCLYSCLVLFIELVLREKLISYSLLL